MPIYEYMCAGCGKNFEVLLASRTAKAACPHCGSRKLKRLFSTFAAHGGVSTAPPCDSGRCPAAGTVSSGSCAGGQCPFSR